MDLIMKGEAVFDIGFDDLGLGGVSEVVVVGAEVVVNLVSCCSCAGGVCIIGFISI